MGCLEIVEISPQLLTDWWPNMELEVGDPAECFPPQCLAIPPRALDLDLDPDPNTAGHGEVGPNQGPHYATLLYRAIQPGVLRSFLLVYPKEVSIMCIYILYIIISIYIYNIYIYI